MKKSISSEKDHEITVCPDYESKGNMRIIWLIILFIVSWSLLLYYYSPREIVNMLGVHNIYVFVFLMAAIGGVSTFTSTTFYATLVTIALGGVNTILVALFASVGLTLGDILFYYLGAKSKHCIKGRYASHVLYITKKIDNIGDRMIMVLIFLYSLTPLPSDIIAISLAIVEFPFKKMVLPLFIGNFTLIIILAELSKLGYSFI